MTEKFPLLIPGATTDDGVLEVYAPWDNALIGKVTAADEAAVEKALETADALFRNRDNWLHPSKRIEILEKAAAIMASRADELAVGAAREGGKPLVDSQVEVARAIDSVKSCIETLRTHAGKEIPMNLNAASSGKIAMTHREPIGVVVALSAFNHPLNLIVHQVGPAVATGCPVIVKPASDTPLSCMRFVEILRQAGLPEQWCQALVVKDISLAQKLVSDNRLGFLSFIWIPLCPHWPRAASTTRARFVYQYSAFSPMLPLHGIWLSDWPRRLGSKKSAILPCQTPT